MVRIESEWEKTMREFLRAKIHGARITKADLDYEGSLGIDSALLQKADIKPFESVEVYNVTNGERLRTYAIELPAGSGRIESNGAAAHWMRPGDKVIIASYAWLEETKLQAHRPKILIVTDDNKPKRFYEAFIEGAGPQSSPNRQAPRRLARLASSSKIKTKR